MPDGLRGEVFLVRLQSLFDGTVSRWLSRIQPGVVYRFERRDDCVNRVKLAGWRDFKSTAQGGVASTSGEVGPKSTTGAWMRDRDRPRETGQEREVNTLRRTYGNWWCASESQTAEGLRKFFV